MPRLFHRPPKYRLHKGTKQAIVSINGNRIYLGPCGSERSHQQYQVILKQWQAERHHKRASESQKSRAQAVIDAVTVTTLWDKRRQGHAISIN